MAQPAGRQPRSAMFRGLEQFEHRGETNGVGYCIAGPKPYALEFSNTADVICLLLGDINSNTKFEDDREQSLVFLNEFDRVPSACRQCAGSRRRGSARIYRLQLR